MKKPLLIVLTILVVILALPVTNIVRWALQTKKPLDVIILDKTVPTLRRENHRSLTWILTQERFVKYVTVTDTVKPGNLTGEAEVVKTKKNKGSYSFRKDYYGFFPTRPLREKGWRQNSFRLGDIYTIVEQNDALYYTDTYGVYSNDWWLAMSKTRRSRRLYGGLNNFDWLYFLAMQQKNKLVIMEYNTIDYPTAELERYKVEEKLGITGSGWTGKYLSSLDSASSDDFPIWMTAMYRKEHKKPWTFSKPGIVLLSEKNIIVLEEGTHLKNAMPYIITDSAYCNKYGLAKSVAFDRWFEIVDPIANNVVSNFSLQTTVLGDSLLSDNLLTNSFPAVIQEPVNKRTYYFSGDFAANIIPFWADKFKGIGNMKGIFYSEKPDDTRRFFWLYYKPLISGIFNEYYDAVRTN